MLSRNETTIWRRLERLEERVDDLEAAQVRIEARIRAELKEAADRARGR